MRVDQLLVKKGLCSSRQEAREAIARGKVVIDGLVIKRPSKDVSEDSLIELGWVRPYVSRGGEKLEGTLYSFLRGKAGVMSFVGGKSALDVGSSTGGFTDFLLQHGIGEVTCIDVGTSQLHERVKSNAKVTSFESMDIRNFISEKKYEIIVGDVSFISLQKILNKIVLFASDGALFCLLIKPQFEVGRGNTKKGIVKDEILVKSVLDQYLLDVTLIGGEGIKIVPSRIVGSDGNQEYFIIFTINIKAK